MLALFGVKGGVGTTTMAAVAGLAALDRGDVRLVDLGGGDLAPLLGVERPTLGVDDWSRFDGEVPLDSLDRLAADVVAASGRVAGSRLQLLGARSAGVQPAALPALGAQLAAWPGTVVVDCGQAPSALVRPVSEWQGVCVALVVRCSYLAAHRARRLLSAEGFGARVDEVIALVDRAAGLRVADLELALGRSVRSVPVNPTLDRIADAGLLAGRCPSDVRAAVRGLA